MSLPFNMSKHLCNTAHPMCFQYTVLDVYIHHTHNTSSGVFKAREDKSTQKHWQSGRSHWHGYKHL